jgi:hypothetical protein
MTPAITQQVGVTGRAKHELRRRSTVEPMIWYANENRWMDRNGVAQSSL